MQTSRALAGLALSLLLLHPDAQARTRPAGSDSAGGPDAAARAINAFGAALYRKLDTAGNLILSPYSLHTALEMAYAGARGRTRTEMAAALRLPADADSPHVRSARLRGRIDPLAAAGGARLRAANALWTQSGMTLQDPFLAVQQRAFGAEPRRVDFRADPEAQRLLINRWAEDATEGTIRDLIPPGILDATTRLVLGNAIYFKGTWAAPFDASQTDSGTFHLSPKQDVRVPLMRLSGRFRIAESEGFSLLELPYAGGDVSMVICLPDSSVSLARAEKAWIPRGMDKGLDRLAEAPMKAVDGVLPRFRSTHAIEASGLLKQMGMPTAFQVGKADFSGITGNKELNISKVLHKAFVETNEEGTEASAASAVVLQVRGGISRPKVFRADRPFLFLIRENRTGLALFMGRVADPRG